MLFRKIKILFLDVDGVLNNETTSAVAPSGCTGIMDSKVSLLKEIIDKTGARIVLSSDWRLCDPQDIDYVYLVNKLRHKGISIFGKTPDASWGRRGEEILSWLDKHRRVESWAVLDDIKFNDFYNDEFEGHLVITDYKKGLTQNDVAAAVRILNEE